jgi:hypothetical protein
MIDLDYIGVEDVDRTKKDLSRIHQAGKTCVYKTIKSIVSTVELGRDLIREENPVLCVCNRGGPILYALTTFSQIHEWSLKRYLERIHGNF